MFRVGPSFVEYHAFGSLLLKVRTPSMLLYSVSEPNFTPRGPPHPELRPAQCSHVMQVATTRPKQSCLLSSSSFEIIQVCGLEGYKQYSVPDQPQLRTSPWKSWSWSSSPSSLPHAFHKCKSSQMQPLGYAQQQPAPLRGMLGIPVFTLLNRPFCGRDRCML